MKYFVYCRKSTEDEGRQVLSIASQRAELARLFFDVAGIEIAEVLDESRSAKAPGRPIFDEMLRRIERGQAAGIIAWHPDRLARNSVDGGRIIHFLDRGLLRDLKFATFTFENNSQGKFMLSITFGYSKYYVDSLSDNVKRGNRTKAQQGWWPNRAPIGYLNDQVAKRIVDDPERFPFVRRIWEGGLAGASPRELWLLARDDWGLRTVKGKRRGGKPLSLSAIYRTLTNPFYAGVVEWEGQRYAGRHTAMISIEEFDRMQRLLGRPSAPRPKQYGFPYRGLIRCGACGLSVTAEHKLNRFGDHYIYYHCTRRHRDPRCTEPSIEARELDRQVLHFVKTTVPDAVVHRFSVEHLDRMQERTHARNAESQRALRRAHEETIRSLANLRGLRVREMISEEEFVADYRKLDLDRMRLAERIAHEPSDEFEPLRLMLSFSNRAVDWVSRGDDATKRLVVSAMSSNLRLRSRILSIEARKPFKRLSTVASFPELRAVVQDVRTWREEPWFTEMISIIKTLLEKMKDEPLDRAA